MKQSSPLRAIPAVDRILLDLPPPPLPRAIVVERVRSELGKLRSEGTIPEYPRLLERIAKVLEQSSLRRIRPVINGTGILIHTNLGRSPLSAPVVAAIAAAGAHYGNLELDLVTGDRGGRAAYLEECLALLCHAEAATVVNNCAAALVLILRHFARAPRQEVVISRGELVQIGGGFRIPEILEASGASLREVGTTNKTGIEDYERAIGPATGLILKVHQSNFYMGGFVEFPSTPQLAALAAQNGVPFVEDLGSGAVIHTESFEHLGSEPTPQQILRDGATLVCFSGDKLLGGPQAGIIAGNAGAVSALKRDPFYRALRCDKLILAGLQALAEAYLSVPLGKLATLPPEQQPTPILAMLATPEADLLRRGEAMIIRIADLPLEAKVGTGIAQVGGGTLPRCEIPSVTLDVRPRNQSLEKFAARLRMGTHPVVGYILDDQFKLDLRTVFPEQDAFICDALRQACAANTDAG
jgi:L-seryl-tRNA(Ser) seleniumtransferase